MKKIFFVCFTFLVAITLVACKKDVSEVLINGDFETEQLDGWVGWTRSGAAFSTSGVVESDTSGGITVEKTGKKWFSGIDGGTQKMVGELTSNTFKLDGIGKIAFKLGAAKSTDIHVDFYIEGNKTPVVSVTNTDFAEPWITVQLIRRVVDLSEHIGKNVYISVVDNDKTDDFGYVNLDDFVVIQSEDDLKKYEAERTDQLSRLQEPEFIEDETSTTIVNGGFEEGNLTGWKILTGSAFSNAGIVSTDQGYWADDLDIYGWGNYYFDGNNDGQTPESYIGSMRSTKFTLAGDGFISFMIGGSNNLTYVAINDGNTGEELVKVYNETFKDPSFALTLRRVYVDMSEHIGKVLYISVVDEKASGGFAFITVDDFRVSLTEENVNDLMLEQYENVLTKDNETVFGNLAAIREYYREYDYPFASLPVLKFNNLAKNVVGKAGTEFNVNNHLANTTASFGDTLVDVEVKEVLYNDEVLSVTNDIITIGNSGIYEIKYEADNNGEIIEASYFIEVQVANNLVNGGFELGDLTGWEVIEGSIAEGDVISRETTFWGEEISFNKTGDNFFNGWSAGIEESAGYALKSTVFELSGSGFISFKLGGNAAYVKVYVDGTDELIGYYKNDQFKDEAFPSIAGGRLATMTTFFADLSEHVGKSIYIVAGDDETIEGWAVAMIDNVVGYFEETPVLTFDSVLESILNEDHPNYTDGTRVQVEIAHVLAENLA